MAGQVWLASRHSVGPSHGAYSMINGLVTEPSVTSDKTKIMTLVTRRLVLVTTREPFLTRSSKWPALFDFSWCLSDLGFMAKSPCGNQIGLARSYSKSGKFSSDSLRGYYRVKNSLSRANYA